MYYQGRELCPKCHSGMTECGQSKGGFSAGKAAVGLYLAGPVGLAAGALGKKRYHYKCPFCGYELTK